MRFKDMLLKLPRSAALLLLVAASSAPLGCNGANGLPPPGDEATVVVSTHIHASEGGQGGLLVPCEDVRIEFIVEPEGLDKQEDVVEHESIPSMPVGDLGGGEKACLVQSRYFVFPVDQADLPAEVTVRYGDGLTNTCNVTLHRGHNRINFSRFYQGCTFGLGKFPSSDQ